MSLRRLASGYGDGMIARRLSRPLVAALLGAVACTGVILAPPAGADDADEGTDYGRMILVLDSSGSMAEPAAGGSTKIEAARTALGDVIDNLPESAYVGLRVYGATVFSREQKGACTDSQLVVEPGQDNRDRLSDAVRRFEPYGETPIAHALRAAAKDIGGEGKRSIVLVSDGIATCAPDPCDVAAELAEAGIDLQIDVVGLSVDPQARAQLRCIAAAGNGTYYDADSADDIVDSLSTAAERALRPFEIDGTPVDGGPDPERAASLEVGRFADRIRPEGEKWYRFERSLPGSTVLLSYYQQVPGAFSRLSAQVTTESGASCPWVGPTPLFHSLFTGYARIVGGDADHPCSSEPLLIRISSTATDGAPAVYGLGIVEEPPLADPDALPGAVDRTRFRAPRPTRPEPVVAGSSFGDAVLLEGGRTYRGTIVPGEVQAFRVQVGWGQKLAVRIDRPALTPAQAEQVSATTDYFDLQVLNPLRASVDDDLDGELASTQRMESAPTRQVTGTVPVRWRNREDRSGSFVAGDYYVVYGADFETDRSVELPFTITVAVQGREAGAPAYVDDASPIGLGDPTASPDPDADPDADPGSTDPSAGDSGGPSGGSSRLVVAGGLVLVAAVAAGAGVVLLLRRRTRAAGPGRG